jgi:cytochrome c oxidase subunit 1
MVGARNIAFPRLNAFSYWIFLFGGLMLFTAFVCNTGPDVGWFSYVPLSGPEYGVGKRPDFWAQLVTFTEISALLIAIEIIVTVLKMRAPGMTLTRIPLFAWAMLVTSFMVIFAMPAVMLGSGFLMSDRLVSTHFFNPAEGGDALLWQHLFWFFGHPEVYIIFVPALGIVSHIVATFARRPVIGYKALVVALVLIGFLAFGLWVHHMFVTGLPAVGMSFFTAASMAIAIPTGMQIFCWIATIATGNRIRFTTPMLFVLGFFVTFIIGGITGVMVASVALDSQLHDSYFVVAHLHYVLIGGAVFPLVGGLYFWFPKITGRMMPEAAGKLQFWLTFIGFHLTFFPMHVLGLEGMPRRIYTYAEWRGWQGLNTLASAGAVVLAAGMLVFFVNAIVSWRRGRVAGANPWDAATLEWATSSPPPAYNFERVPVVRARDPLWAPGGIEALVTGMPHGVRAVLVTRVHDATPDHVSIFPPPTIWPLISAVAVTGMLIASIFTPWGVVWGALPAAAALIAWFWPRREETEKNRAVEVKPHDAPTGVAP